MMDVAKAAPIETHLSFEAFVAYWDYMQLLMVLLNKSHKTLGALLLVT
jgi:hypothetical protein